MQSSTVPPLADHAALLSEIAPAGCYIALRLGFLSAEEELNLFPPSWVRTYAAATYSFKDPLILWAMQKEGIFRWSKIDTPDPFGVLPVYRKNGLHYGCVVSLPAKTSPANRKSFGIFGRSEREYLDHELDELARTMEKLHMQPRPELTPTQAEALRMLIAGDRYKVIADRLGITESAVKARFKSACDRLGARTAVQAANIAQSRGLL